jgi:hypothetical protein
MWNLNMNFMTFQTEMDRREIPVALVKTERNWSVNTRIQNKESVSPGLSEYAVHLLTAAYLLKIVIDAQNKKVRDQIKYFKIMLAQ